MYKIPNMANPADPKKRRFATPHEFGAHFVPCPVPALITRAVSKNLPMYIFLMLPRFVLVRDNLNTHYPCSLYEAFSPAAGSRQNKTC